MRFQEHQHRAALNVGVDEMIRQERHHDVLCLVLKEFISHDCAVMRGVGEEASKPIMRAPIYLADLLGYARTIADLAYPPPKQEPSE